jgi:hypothetical protein
MKTLSGDWWRCQVRRPERERGAGQVETLAEASELSCGYVVGDRELVEPDFAHSVTTALLAAEVEEGEAVTPSSWLARTLFSA